VDVLGFKEPFREFGVMGVKSGRGPLEHLPMTKALANVRLAELDERRDN
jgi:hypothetical protein